MTTERHESRSRFAWVGLGLSLALGACAGGPPRAASDLAAEVPPELRADYNTFRENCSKCHSLDRPLQAHVDAVGHWDLYVGKMMRTAGSGISKIEAPKILRFLYWYTERRNRLKAEAKRAKQSVVVEEKAPTVAPEPAPAVAPAPAQDSVPAPDPTPVSEPVPAATQSQQGEGAP